MNPVDLVTAASQHSRYLRRLVAAEAHFADTLVAHLDTPWNTTLMQAQLDALQIVDAHSLQVALRKLRQAVMAQMVVRDLAGLGDLHEVMRMCTDLAQVAVRYALRYHTIWLAETHGMPMNADGTPMELAVVGMGKLGGGELNVSSDIDLVYLYADEGETTGDKPISYHQFFVLLAKKIGLAISEITADGFVFRVDTRLRPWGDAGPLAMGYAAFEDYLVTHGREWERYAWIKGRALTGSRLDELNAIVRPFVFRKYLDFNAFAAMRELHAQIRREVIRRDRVDNIKLGPGGIREIEFIAQVFQLIRGGQVPALQARATLAILPMLAARGSLPEQAVSELREAYFFLRNLEHRLQYLDDAQTQMLPTQAEEQSRIASSMGFADYSAFLLKLNMHRTHVSRHFDQVFAAPQADGTHHPLSALWLGLIDEEESKAQLANLGFDDADAVYQRLQQSRKSSRYVGLPASNRARLDTLVPQLIEVAASLPPRDSTLARIMDLLETVSRRASYLALLVEYPATLRQLAKICAASPWAAQYLTRNPMLLDELLDTRVLYTPPDWVALRAELAAQMQAQEGDVERQMDGMRHFRQRVTFHLLAQDLAGILPLEKLSDYLSDLAALILDATLPLAWAGVRNRHCEAPHFAIIGYGKLGGRELGYASDLDMVFLYQDDAPDAAEHYARLAQRIITWLSSTTAAGILYETDLRLRPDGASGLLVSSIAAFSEYQRNHAWTWEHQALTRARFVAGDAAVGALFEPIRCDILTQQRDLAKLREDVRNMRQKMHDGHPNHSALFDIKHDAGGIVDVEFIVQYLILAYSARHRQLTENAGNLALLKIAAELGLIASDTAEAVRTAYRQFRQLQHSLRLQGADAARVEGESVAVHANAVKTLWTQVLG
ncbi:bifunctional [glutamate--ammonia ligase]-adenylyl-L-tyrosine phosphorylase/[glutamate--ammonia-ligase] adenylyltransferase [Sulfuriferula thiophila]|uniref:bifunctional [glutamate--ammonia ligase]-adenylyl-L-tyrosine phosphorylase/[glutamate--ammonia-ligase] adenylyltransferase n=1 Tax=Sulfuriferula thiophila TaxID=1781211 RepID=UPI000F607B3C|nr:bifunctional [glutamate--ammonia ligase]-adenylyl-L-tyrosine phosphorylase/[glutamate--ammonia-ligase] adenylyltransferase [Sulfuriferula thiophila]